jgi:hypothetical protein
MPHSVPLVRTPRRGGWRDLGRVAAVTLRVRAARMLLDLAKWVLPRRP